MDNGTAIKFNWHRFWTKATGIRRQSAHVGQFGNPDLLGRFFEEMGMPDDFAAFGCGPADGPWELASRYPDLSVFGYDIAESAIETAKTSADARELSNVSFAVDSLPNPSIDHSISSIVTQPFTTSRRSKRRFKPSMTEHGQMVTSSSTIPTDTPWQ